MSGTVLLSAMVSIVTGYIGSLLSTGWLRKQERRIYGLALLAEVKSIHRSLWRYQTRMEVVTGSSGSRYKDLRLVLGLWRQDLSVYANNSGHIGLFSARTAVEIIEFYHRVRWLELRVAELDAEASPDDEVLSRWLAAQNEALRLARQHSRYLGRLLRREIPATAGERFRAVRRGRWRRRAIGSRRRFLRSVG
ncbi:hypothetical protein P7D22_11650 [Lichenihabitans sp. Uapishka_5]|uniref:hypothetical protein n=1 Tax=Lichenihabitans sp. Uapishka_5 TaxID=3037302 RepID=UPI0029E7CF50|nr:hypothetical protein [Lichenihabitans sp. Uapishka_5]MDX7951824.1 hypothetical protein [Lichenihabitans sp. Uapishka_5]